MWKLSYPTQRITVPGEGEVTVIGGSSHFNTHQAAVGHLEQLRKRWTGLKADITPVLQKDTEGGASDLDPDGRAYRHNARNHYLRRGRATGI